MLQINKSSNIFYSLTFATLVSIPFDGLAIDFGSRLRLSNLLSIASLVVLTTYFLFTQAKTVSNSYYGRFVVNIIILFCLSTFIGNLFFLFDRINPQAQVYFDDKFGSDGISVFRTVLKPIQAFIATLTQLQWILIPLLAIRSNHQVFQLAWGYIISASIQAGFAIFQFIFYLATKINLFPMYRGSLLDENIETQDAFFSMGGTDILRVNAFAGEPKGLALVLCLSLVILYFFVLPQVSGNLKKSANTYALIQFTALMLTFSTLGYALLAISFSVYFFLSKKKIWFLINLTIILTITFYTVGIPSTVNDIFQARFLERIGFEDFDLVYLEFIGKHPDYLFFGSGFGTFHLASFEAASQIIKWKFGIILPKIGLFSLLATSGFPGIFFFSSLLFKSISKLSYLVNILPIKESTFCLQIRDMFICLIAVSLVFRFTTFGCLWIGISFAVIENILRYVPHRNQQIISTN
jgi:hypothetical protein